MSKQVEYNHAPSEQSRSYDMLLPGMGARYHRFETEPPTPRLRTTASQVTTKSVSARPLHVVDEPTERRDPPAHATEQQTKGQSLTPDAAFPQALQAPSLRETQQHARLPIKSFFVAPNTTGAREDNEAIGNPLEEPTTMLENVGSDAPQTNKDNKPDPSAILQWTTPPPAPRVRFSDDDLVRRAKSFAAEGNENETSERSERQRQTGLTSAAAAQEDAEADANSGSGLKNTSTWLSAKVPSETNSKSAMHTQSDRKRASFASLSAAQRKAVVSVVQFLITTVAVFVLLVLLNPPFVQQQPQTTVAGPEASAMSTFSVQPTDLPKALAYAAIGGALAAALPYAWEFFVGIVPGSSRIPGASSRTKPPVRRYRRKRRQKSV